MLMYNRSQHAHINKLNMQTKMGIRAHGEFEYSQKNVW